MTIKKDFFKNKNILITGHTGFKGSWLSQWLLQLGARVSGYALAPDRDGDNHFDMLDLSNHMESRIGNICDYTALEQCINISKPDIIFHMAAQPLVRYSYDNPTETYATNVMGTVNLFDIVRKQETDIAVINVTTDKCYENKEWIWPYREVDRLGGHDPYSASKACSEIVTSSFQRSYASQKHIKIASARGGNVVGGGDFSKDRIIPDIVKSIKNNETLEIRSPDSVRPWQHVLDVLHGYLLLAQTLYLNDDKIYQSAYNISPSDDRPVTVKEIVECFIGIIGKGSYIINKDVRNPHEAKMLRLDSSKAKEELGWKNLLNTEDTLNLTALWYDAYLQDNISQITKNQINEYMNRI